MVRLSTSPASAERVLTRYRRLRRGQGRVAQCHEVFGHGVGSKIRVNALIVGLVHNEAGVEHYGGEEGFKRVAEMLPLNAWRLRGCRQRGTTDVFRPSGLYLRCQP